MVHLAKMQEIENPAMATMKASSIPSDAMSREAAAAQDSVLARGRDGYLNLGAIRTKPGMYFLVYIPCGSLMFTHCLLF